jgi:hypothetical protein
MKRALFVTEKWCDGKPTLPFSSNFYHMFHTFQQGQPHITYNTMHLDESQVIYGQHIDESLINYCKTYRPHIVFFSLLGQSLFNPTKEAFAALKEMGILLCFLWPDTGPGWGGQTINELGDMADLHVSVDNPHYRGHQLVLKDNHILLWVPQDENLFHKDTQDIPVSFIGSKVNYPDRQMFIQHLVADYPDIVLSGGQREAKLTFDQYAKLIRRSQIGINFSISLAGFYQTKSRVMEIISSGSLLLEFVNPATASLFVPGREYVEFHSADDLIDKIKYYSTHEEERLKIANAGHEVYQNNYTPKHFWQKIVDKIKL